MPAKRTIENMKMGPTKKTVKFSVQYGSFTSVENLSVVGDDEYITARKIARIFGVSQGFIKKLGILDQIDYIVMQNRTRGYLWKQVVAAMHTKGFTVPVPSHPMAEVSIDMIIADTGVDRKNFYKQIALGRITPHKKPGEPCLYVYMGEYDAFLRGYFLPDSLRWIGSQPLYSGEAAVFCGYIDTGAFNAAVNRGMMPSLRIPGIKGARRKFTKAALASWLDNCHKTFRRNPLPDALNAKLGAMYMRRSLWQFKQIAKYLTPVEGKTGYYTRESMDRWYMKEWCMDAYGEHQCYYTPAQICAKFGRTMAWVNEYIVGKCDVYTTRRYVMTQAEFRKKYLGKPDRYPLIFGYSKPAVEEIVKNSPELHDIPETVPGEPGVHRHPRGVLQLTREKEDSIKSKISTARRKQEKRKAREKEEAAAADTLKIDENSLELAIRAAVRRNSLERDAKYRESRQKVHAFEKEQNAIRNMLGIAKKSVRISPKAMIQVSKVPMNVYMVHTVGFSSGLFTERMPEPGALVVKSPDLHLPVKSKKERCNSFSVVSNEYDKVQELKPAAVPAWYVLVGGSTVINDIQFPEKLAAVPADVAAVGAFGYERFMPDGSWMESPFSYGIYSAFDVDVRNSEWVMGKKGVNGSHQVAVIDGPFIAVRGIYGDILAELRQFSPLWQGDTGQRLMAAVISLVLGRMGLKLMQLPIDCSMCRQQPVMPGSLDWNRIEDTLIKFYKHK